MTTIACIFPGQGSQFVGMLQEFGQDAIVRDTFVSVSDRLGYDVWALTQQGPESTLNQTEYTQVAMLTADVALFKVLQQRGLASIKVMAGHSLGEYAALVCADALAIEDAAALVAQRGQYMQQTVPLGQGAMAAIIGLSDEQVQSACEQASDNTGQVSAANYNAIGQVVIAGNLLQVEKAIEIANALGARMAKIIPVSVPCHCALLKDAANLFEETLQATEFKIPTIPVISNVDLSIYKSAPHIRALLKEQLYSPVRWVETIQKIQQEGIDCIIECGPGKVLSGLVKRIDKSLNVMCVNDVTSMEKS